METTEDWEVTIRLTARRYKQLKHSGIHKCASWDCEHTPFINYYLYKRKERRKKTQFGGLGIKKKWQ